MLFCIWVLMALVPHITRQFCRPINHLRDSAVSTFVAVWLSVTYIASVFISKTLLIYCLQGKENRILNKPFFCQFFKLKGSKNLRTCALVWNLTKFITKLGYFNMPCWTIPIYINMYYERFVDLCQRFLGINLWITPLLRVCVFGFLWLYTIYYMPWIYDVWIVCANFTLLCHIKNNLSLINQWVEMIF